MMHTKAQIAELAVKASAAGGATVTSLAWWGANSAAITAMCAFATFIVVVFTAIMNWHYKYNHKPKLMETIMTDEDKKPKKDKKPEENEPEQKGKSVPCGDPSNPC